MQVKDLKLLELARSPARNSFNRGMAQPRQNSRNDCSARTTLRAATHDIHARLHHHPALARLAAGTIGRDEYRLVLARSYGFYLVVEPALGLGRRLTDYLAGDLAELGMTPVAIAGLPWCPALAFGKKPGEMIGARYVLLGASLGGMVMARAITGRSGGDNALPVRFLTGMGENDWQLFAANLEANLPDAPRQANAAQAAAAMFGAYEEWMTVYE